MAGIIVLADVIVPNSLIAAGVTGKLMRRNTRVQSQSGRQQINIDWARSLRQYEWGSVPMPVALWQTFEGLFEVTEAGAYGMLLQDPKDISVGVAEGVLYPYTTALVGTIGLGYGVPTHKLYKRYAAAGTTRTKDRAITRPQPTPALLRGGSPVTLGAGAGNAAIDLTTGTVTFVADTSQALTSITAGATTVLNFSSGTPIVAALAVGQRVYVSGVTGTAAAALNGLSHAITAKGASSLTVSTVTTGLAGTGGTAYKYPQITETLTWSGRLYVPVHFASDQIDWNLAASGDEDSRFVIGPNVVLAEVRE